jgi:DNA-binding transcriptional ArsR family regulator
MYVGEIAAHLALPLGTVSRHMRTLHAAGVVECSQQGNRVLYVLSDREVPRLAVAAYRGAAAHARRVIASAPELPAADLSAPDSAES